MDLHKGDNPDFLNQYLNYLTVIKGLTPRTIEGYYQDIRLFLRYINMKKNNLEGKKELEVIPFKDVSVDDIKKVDLEYIYDFLSYMSDTNGDDTLARARKSSALRGLFKYLYKNKGVLDSNPTDRIETPVVRKKMPMFLEIDECQKLLKTVREKGSARDECIITLFINCGMRLSELVGLNIDSISFDEMRMRVTGKGQKERLIYLNKSCMNALKAYLPQREKLVERLSKNEEDNNSETYVDPKALFLSRLGKRISKRRVQQIVELYLKESDVYRSGLSTHKLRHTAATLMYTYAGADMTTLKEVLGHESTATTEIYTHVTSDTLRNVADSMPFENNKK